MSNTLYIVTSGGFYGHYGRGDPLEKAVASWRKAGGRKNEGFYRVQKFSSELPFAPPDRKALETEADAWVGQDGSMNWVRCEREELVAPKQGRVKRGIK